MERSRLHNSNLFRKKRRRRKKNSREISCEEYRVHFPGWIFNEDGGVYNSMKRFATFPPYSTLNLPPLGFSSPARWQPAPSGGVRVVTPRRIVVCRWRATYALETSSDTAGIIHGIRSYRGKWGIPGNGAQQPAHRPAPTFKSRSRGNFTERLLPVAALVSAPSIWISTIAAFARDRNAEPRRGSFGGKNSGNPEIPREKKEKREG